MPDLARTSDRYINDSISITLRLTKPASPARFCYFVWFGPRHLSCPWRDTRSYFFNNLIQWFASISSSYPMNR
jgi:hypothetical protein